jgi:hypothetical protein
LKRNNTIGSYGLRAKDGRDIVIVMMVVFGAIAMMSTGLRIVSRKMRKVSFGLDDYFMVIAGKLSSDTLQKAVTGQAYSV